ncbi:FAD-dependent oxidoreductase [Microbacterium dauci]|uniref:FAD-dependent oxidoreductase n=1 Tax=Microbacterium dauci TaxID=3048008 RepID=A0ABT6ZG00_9MICO|nr:FAD-dependent oxidoreductase [Microbacterium sp. LX3-4]MDJ1115092.1 FAD-dependent oxidoreductase [Microbacterium sp. LX3-4]
MNIQETNSLTFDVVVCGGGPAGVAAAVASARLGARTALVELQGCLGGIWTAGSLSWIIDVAGKDGTIAEIIRRLDARDARTGDPGADFTYDVEAMKLILESMCVEAGVYIQLHTRVVSVESDHRVRSVTTESKSGRQRWSASVFVDATGDGDVAALAGCTFEVGHPDTGDTQPMSLMALVGGVPYAEIAEFVAGGHAFLNPGDDDHDEPKQRLLAEIRAAGVEPSYKGPTLFRVTDSLFALMVNHEYGRSGLNAQDLTDATLNARREINVVVDALRSASGPWRNLRLISTAGHIGVREGRRVIGRDYVTRRDVAEGRQRRDSICSVRYGADVHALSSGEGGYLSPETGDLDLSTRPYDIPYGAMVPRDVGGLLTAGRCISGDFWAHASYRVTGNAVTIGEAAGVAAATSAKTDVLPSTLDWTDFVAARAHLRAITSDRVDDDELAFGSPSRIL